MHNNDWHDQPHKCYSSEGASEKMCGNKKVLAIQRAHVKHRKRKSHAKTPE